MTLAACASYTESCPTRIQDRRFCNIVVAVWDPPWKRVRRARGPPQVAQSTAQPRAQGLPSAPAVTIDTVINDELYSVDEIPSDHEG